MTRQVPYALAFAGGFLLELQDRLLMRSRPPRVTRYGAWLLGSQPGIQHREGAHPVRLAAVGRLRREHRKTIRWLLEREAHGRNGTVAV